MKRLERFDSITVASWFFLVAAIFLLPIFLLGAPLPTITLLINAKWAILSGFLYSAGFYCYVRALALEDTSLIAPLYNISLIWIILFAALFLDESLTIFKVIGGTFMFLGIFTLYQGNFKTKLMAIKDSLGSILMLVGSIFLASGRTIDAWSIQTIDSRTYAFLINLYVGLWLLFATIVTGRTRIIGTLIREEPTNLVLAGITNGWSYLLLLIAVLGLGLSIAEPLSLLSVFVTAILAKMFLDESIKERLPGTLMIVFGAIFIFL